MPSFTELIVTCCLRSRVLITSRQLGRILFDRDSTYQRMVWHRLVDSSLVQLLATRCLTPRVCRHHSSQNVCIKLDTCFFSLLMRHYFIGPSFARLMSLNASSRQLDGLTSAYLDFILFPHSFLSVMMWYYFICSSLARLVLSGCICNEGSPAFSPPRSLVCISL